MTKPKASAKTASLQTVSGNQQKISVIQKTPSQLPVTGIKILYQGTCPKLTSRGRGDLSYELGANEATGKPYLRISANVSSGAFSNEWLALSRIEALLDTTTAQKKVFPAAVMDGLFTRRSANNCGYLAAILKAEGILSILPGKPVLLELEGWKVVTEKIEKLRSEGVCLTDHIAILAEKRAEQKERRLSNPESQRPTKPTKSTSKKEEMGTQDAPSQCNAEPEIGECMASAEENDELVEKK